jgi:hypothetical protein
VRASMRHKVKVAVSFYQCIAAVPSVFDVSTPSRLQHLTKWVDLLELPASIGVYTVIPAECFGSYRNQLLITACWPIVFLLVLASVSPPEFARCRNHADTIAVRAGLCWLGAPATPMQEGSCSSQQAFRCACGAPAHGSADDGRDLSLRAGHGDTHLQDFLVRTV